VAADKAWIGVGKPVPGAPPNVRQAEGFARLPPQEQVKVAALAQEWAHGTSRLTEATLRLEEHSKDLVRLTWVLIGVTVVLVALTIVLIFRVA